jgi:hypothetical protein
MEKEKELFFWRLKDKDGNIPTYNLDDFAKYVLHDSKISMHKREGCARRYPIYLKTFIIPLEELEGGDPTTSKSRFRKRVANTLKEFINSKKAQPQAQTVAEVSPNAYHHVVIAAN